MDAHPPDESAGAERSDSPPPFAELYRQHVGRLYRYALARLGNADDAQDLTAQTFTAALRGLSQYRGDGSVAAWLTSIARNLAASGFRTRRPSLPLDDADDLPAADPSPEDVTSRRLRLEAVLAALDTLPADHAEVIRLRFFGELSTAETAALLGKSEAAVKMTLHRALQTLRRRVAADEQEPLQS